MANLLEAFPVVVEIPIAWGDMDAFQHVNNVRYFRFMESSRVAYFQALGYMDFMRDTGIGPILATAQCRFKIPLTYPDTVSVGTRMGHMEEDRCTMEHLMVSHRHGKVAAEGDGLIVSFHYGENRKVPFPAEIIQRIQDLEGRDLL